MAAHSATKIFAMLFQIQEKNGRAQRGGKFVMLSEALEMSLLEPRAAQPKILLCYKIRPFPEMVAISGVPPVWPPLPTTLAH